MALDLEIKEAVEVVSQRMSAKLAEIGTAQKEMSEKLAVFEEKKASGEDVADIQARLKESSEELTKLGETMTEMQKKASARSMENKSAGRIMAEQKDFGSRLMSGERMEMKDITTGSFGNVTMPAGLRRTNRGLIEPLTQQLYLRDVLPGGTTSAAVVEYLQEAGYTNNAATVAEGAIKPQSELTFTGKTMPMVKMAHMFRVSEETLDDVDQMESYINQRGLYGLMLKEEQEILNGDGTSGRIDGVIANSTTYVGTTVPGVTPDNAMDDIRVAIAQVAEADLMASTVIMNHLDAAALDLEKDADGNYLHPSFSGNTAWGLPVVRTKGLAQGNFIVAGFQGNSMLWQKKGIEIRRSTEDRDNFQKNLVSILLEERLQLETLRPEGIIYGALTVPAP
ncbi:MAG: phage major capsid protein [Phycisphaerae bacterium]|nr:phage major capsid protein [Phycisphaerae bacterium]